MRIYMLPDREAHYYHSGKISEMEMKNFLTVATAFMQAHGPSARRRSSAARPPAVFGHPGEQSLNQIQPTPRSWA
jgi:hypothetical protein